MNIFKKDNPNFPEFIQVLESKLGDLEDVNCNGDFTHSVDILSRYNGFSIEGTIAYWQKLGAYCDCQIISNIV